MARLVAEVDLVATVDKEALNKVCLWYFDDYLITSAYASLVVDLPRPIYSQTYQSGKDQ